MKKHIQHPALVITFTLLFIILFIINAAIYDVVSSQFIMVLLSILSFLPEAIAYNIIIGMSYVFLLPIGWTMELTGLYSITGNQFVHFLISITLTICYLTLLYAIVRKLFFPTKQTSKKST